MNVRPDIAAGIIEALRIFGGQLSEDKLAEELGIPKNTLEKWLGGNIDEEFFEKVSAFSGQSIDFVKEAIEKTGKANSTDDNDPRTESSYHFFFVAMLNQKERLDRAREHAAKKYGTSRYALRRRFDEALGKDTDRVLAVLDEVLGR